MASTTRQSGRHNGQMRMLQSERGVLNRADGSAKWSQDNTSVLVAVYGPRQARERREDAEKAVVEVVYKPRSGLQGKRKNAEGAAAAGALGVASSDTCAHARRTLRRRSVC